MKGIRKTAEQMHEFHAAKAKEFKDKIKKNNGKDLLLTDKSPGMEKLLVDVTDVAKTNKTTVAEVVKAIARIKKTGLNIKNGERKPKVKVLAVPRA